MKIHIETIGSAAAAAANILMSSVQFEDNMLIHH